MDFEGICGPVHSIVLKLIINVPRNGRWDMIVSIEDAIEEKTHGYSCAVGPTGLGLINRDGGIIPK